MIGSRNRMDGETCEGVLATVYLHWGHIYIVGLRGIRSMRIKIVVQRILYGLPTVLSPHYQVVSLFEKLNFYSNY